VETTVAEQFVQLVCMASSLGCTVWKKLDARTSNGTHIHFATCVCMLHVKCKD